jgi:hypothetical protein
MMRNIFMSNNGYDWALIPRWIVAANLKPIDNPVQFEAAIGPVARPRAGKPLVENHHMRHFGGQVRAPAWPFTREAAPGNKPATQHDATGLVVGDHVRFDQTPAAPVGELHQTALMDCLLECRQSGFDTLLGSG